jgi:homoserine dehydrogenase
VGKETRVGVGLIGLGTIGAGVAKLLRRNSAVLEERLGFPLRLVRVADLDLSRARNLDLGGAHFDSDAEALIDDPDVAIVIELIGGYEVARRLILRAVERGKHVVTANKALLAVHGKEIFDAARRRGVDVAFEASVGGGIPILRSLREGLAANRIQSVHGIINGTTNYVLGRMASAGLSLGDAVREAQTAGFAEADPTDDIGGFDATYKLAILGSIAYEIKIRPSEIFREGIEGIEPVDFRYARELGYAIKLIAHTQRHPGRVEARVHPAMVPLDHPLAQVEGANNAVFVEGDLVGQVLLVGQGAGGRPTASAVVGDLIDLARSIRRGVQSRPSFSFDDRIGVIPMGEVKTRAYFRIRVDDRTGILAALGQVFAEEGVSISSLIQKDAWVEEQTAELVVTTHPAPDASLQKARERIGTLSPVHAVSSFLRVF